jgi:hypothetical protein
MSDVYKTGANDPLIPIAGKITRPVHLQVPRSGNYVSSYRNKSLKEQAGSGLRLLLGQYLVTGPPGFGRAGDSGGMVYIEATDGMFIVGTFVGSFDAGNLRFVVTPVEHLGSGSSGLKWMVAPP